MNPLTALWRRITVRKPQDKRPRRPRAVRLQAAVVRQQQYNFLHYTGDVQPDSVETRADMTRSY